MKVNLEYESIDMEGEKSLSKVMAIMEIRESDYRLVFVEDLSGEGNMTRSTMMLSEEGMRIIRKGELNTDFMFGPALVHNTNYATPYGNLPISLITKEFTFSVSHPEFREENPIKSGDVPDGFCISSYAAYDIVLSGQKMSMSMKVRVTKM